MVCDYCCVLDSEFLKSSEFRRQIELAHARPGRLHLYSSQLFLSWREGPAGLGLPTSVSVAENQFVNKKCGVEFYFLHHAQQDGMPIPLYFTSHTHDGFRKRVWFAPSAHTHETTQTVRNPLTQGSCCSTPSRPREAQRLSRDTPHLLLSVAPPVCGRVLLSRELRSAHYSSPLARERSLAHGGKALTSPSPSPVHPKTEAQIAAHQSCLCL